MGKELSGFAPQKYYRNIHLACNFKKLCTESLTLIINRYKYLQIKYYDISPNKLFLMVHSHQTR